MRQSRAADPDGPPAGARTARAPRAGPRTSRPRPSRPWAPAEAQAEGQQAGDEAATAADAQDEEGPPGSHPDARTDDAEGGGVRLARAGRPRRRAAGRGASARSRGPRRAGLPLRRVGPQDRGLPPGLVHPAASTAPTRTQEGFVAGDLPRVRRDRHPDPAQLPADAPRAAAQDALPDRRRRPRHRRAGRVRGRPARPDRPDRAGLHQARQDATAT